jgi:hypothetical protein
VIGDKAQSRELLAAVHAQLPALRGDAPREKTKRRAGPRT